MQLTAGSISAPLSVYFERLAPDSPKGDPLLLLPGEAHSGACYLATADGRPGWAQYFAGEGFDTYVADWPGTGRSGYQPHERLTGEAVVESFKGLIEAIGRPVTVLVHSMSGPYGWKLLATAPELVRRVVGAAPGPPGNVQPIAPILTEDELAVEAELGGSRLRIPKKELMLPAADLGSKLVGDSTHFPRAYLESYLASLLPIPPRLVYERLNIGGSQLRLADGINLSGRHTLVITGSLDRDHPRETDEGIATWLGSRGASAEFIWLPDRGIDRNGHMLMLEDNSDEIAGIIVRWIRESGG